MIETTINDIPVITVWGMWIKFAIYIYSYFDKILNFIKWLHIKTGNRLCFTFKPATRNRKKIKKNL